MQSSTTYFKIGKVILFIVAIILVGQTLFAQTKPKISEEEEKKIKMKIFIEKDGQRKSFEKEYKNQAEMENDPEYRAFKKDSDLTMPPPPLPPNPASFYSFRNELEGKNKRIELYLSDSAGEVPLPPAPPTFEMEAFLSKRMNNLNAMFPDSQFVFHYFKGDTADAALDKSVRYHIKTGGKENSALGSRKKISMEDVEKGKSQDLNFRNFNFLQTSLNGSIKIAFESDKHTVAVIKIKDKSGDLLYMDKVEGTDGKFIKNIDLSDKKKGIYFLEVKQNGKAITKRLAIE